MLDVSFIKCHSTLYDHKVSGWPSTNPGRVASIYQIAKLYDSALIKVSVIGTAINKFCNTSTWTVNGVFNNCDFVPSEIKDRPNTSIILPSVPASSTTLTSVPAGTVTPNLYAYCHRYFGSLNLLQSRLSMVLPRLQSTPMICSKCPTPEDILSIPSCSGLPLKKKSQKYKITVSTESLYKKELL